MAPQPSSAMALAKPHLVHLKRCAVGGITCLEAPELPHTNSARSSQLYLEACQESRDAAGKKPPLSTASQSWKPKGGENPRVGTDLATEWFGTSSLNRQHGGLDLTTSRTVEEQCFAKGTVITPRSSGQSYPQKTLLASFEATQGTIGLEPLVGIPWQPENLSAGFSLDLQMIQNLIPLPVYDLPRANAASSKEISHIQASHAHI